MRRSDREITFIEEKLAVIEKNKVMRLAMVDNGRPYVVPLNYGYTYENGTLTPFISTAPLRAGK